MPCCDVINRGAALYGKLVIFATLDAPLVALNQDTAEVEWKEKIDDYAAGYSASAALLIAQGLLITGVSGGEFGVVGRAEARDPKTGTMVWKFHTGSGVVAPPITREDKGEQYVAVASGWGGAVRCRCGVVTWPRRSTSSNRAARSGCSRSRSDGGGGRPACRVRLTVKSRPMAAFSIWPARLSHSLAR